MRINQLSLSRHEPVEYAGVTLNMDIDGWRLAITHRHRFGQWNDCEREEYEGLTTAEVLDVLDATLTVCHPCDCPECARGR